MNISRIFILRPIMTTLVMVSILIVGLVAYRALPVSELPTVDFPTIRVSANLAGASPETMASAVATVLEREFATIGGIDSMTSISSMGVTQVTIQFNLNRDIDAAAQDVQTAIAAATRHLPQNMTTAPAYRKVNPAEQPILYLAMSSPTLPLSKVDDYADTHLAQRISMLSGVAEVQVYGSQKYAVRVRVDPKALISRAIGIDEVVAAIQSGNVNLPTGNLSGAHRAFTIQASGQLTDAAAYRPLIVAYRNNAPIRLGEVATVLDGVEDDKVASWLNDDRAIILAVQRQPGTNTVEVVQAIKDLLPQYRAEIPASVTLDILYDRSISIKESVRDVQITFLIALILVIFLFLRNLSATVIPSLALPISIVGTFAVMYVAGYTLDNLSLMALTLSVGFVVVDAIVMLENIVCHLEKGESPLEASLQGSAEISFTILSMTISLVAVFIPVLFMGGIVGRLLHEFAVTITVAVLISGFVSLSLTPMLCRMFLKPAGEQRHSCIYQISERFFEGMLRLYDVTLKWALRHRLTTLVLSFIFLVAAAGLYAVISKGFLPSEGRGQITGFTEAAQDISYESMVEHQKQVVLIIAKDPNIEKVMSRAGRGAVRP